MLRSLSRVFASCGWRCCSSAAPLPALELLADAPFDALIVDFLMEPFDGVELCRRARGAGFGGPVVIYSGFVTPELYERAARAGAWAVVPKDTDAQALAALLGTVCEHCARPEAAGSPCTPGDFGAAARAYADAHGLSDHQTQLLECALRDESREQAADRVGVSVGTVHGYWRRICDKTKQRGQHEVVLDLLRFVLAQAPLAHRT